jgi:nucleoside-diphosphate-sugar epimerase
MLDVNKINALGWHPSVTLEDGIKKTYKDFVEKYESYTK